MAVELVTNNASSSLNGAINNSVTSLVVASASGFPSTGNFRILIDSEILLVTAVAGTTFTVTRGVEGTSAASHIDTSAVTHILTAAGLKAFRGDALLSGVYASLPSPGTSGRLYLPTDGPYLLRDNGSAWDAFGPVQKLYVPDSSLFSWINQGGASVSTTGGPIVLNVPASGAKNNRVRVKSAPATPYTITARIQGVAFPSDYWNFGLLFRESGSGKLHTYQIGHISNVTMNSSKFTDPSTFSAFYLSASVVSLPMGVPEWLRIADDGTSRICSFSYDGVNFHPFHTVGRTDFLTADQVGFFGNSENSLPVTVTLSSYLEG